MQKDYIGIIISTEESPSTSEFSFVLNPNNENIVKKGQYVQSDGEQGVIFGYIHEIYRANRYFERAESVAEYERIGSFDENFPTQNWEHVIAETKILGTFQNEKLFRTFSPPKPGKRIFSANEDLLKKFLGFEQGELNLGKLQNHNLQATLGLTKLLQKHIAILAMSGAGKSHFASVLLEEILLREKEKGRISIIVVDIHGEYLGFAQDQKYSGKVKVVEGSNIKIPFRNLDSSMILEWFPRITDFGKFLISDIIYEMKKEMKAERKNYSLSDLLERIENYQTKGYKAQENVKNPIKRAVLELKKIKLISKNENPRLIDDISSGKMLILDLSSIDDMKKKRMIVAYFGRKLFSLRKKEKIPPFLFLVEEAHNFATEKLERSSNISKPIIEKIAREGRKFGACLGLISQRPVNLSTTALSQCNTHVILRITNPNDIQHIGESCEGLDVRMLKNITSLRVGEAIIVGEAVKHPIFLDVRDRNSKKIERGEPLCQQALKYEKSLEKKKNDAEAFL
ncbi:MAG: ATP-binding protein [Candidatus Micrarchaeia archaeon]